MILLVDTWQFGGKIDEATLIANGVSGIFIRINQSNGSLNLDGNFETQWDEAKSMPVRIPYFVFNPAYDVMSMYQWLEAVVPYTARAIALDIEFRNSNVSPAMYKNMLDDLLALCKQKWNTIIYTGQGFLDLLSSWPTNELYWWAQYPLELRPSNVISMTWETLKSKLEKYSAPLNADKVPGKLMCWQFTGDRLILPGCDKPMDVNLWVGTMDELLDFGAETETPPENPLVDTLLEETMWYEGMKYQRYNVRTNHGYVQCHLLAFDMAFVEELFVSPRPSSRRYVPEFLEAHGMDVAVNCDQFVSITPGGFNASRGVAYGLENQNAESVVFIDKLNNPIVKHPPIRVPADLWNAYAFPNMLVDGGQVLQHIRDIDALKGKRPRTASGWSQDKKTFFIFLADGDETYNATTESGFTFVETAEFMVRHGAYVAVMHDGGGSTTGARKNPNGGKALIFNEPRGEDFVAAYNEKMRRVVNILGVRMKTEPSGGGSPPNNGGTMYTYKVLRDVGRRPIPSMDSTSKGNVAAGTQFDSDTVVEDAKFPGTFLVKMPDGYYLPLAWKGVEYVQKIESAPQPEPATVTRILDIDTSTGKVRIDGGAWQ